MVAIHAEVAATDTRESRAALRLRDQLLQITESGAWHGVASVEHRVNGDAGHLFARGEIEQREQMRVDRVHAARPDQADEVQRARVRLGLVARAEERLIAEEAAISDRLGDAHEILLDDAPGAEVQMTDLTVPDLATWQAHCLSRRFQQRLRCSRPESVPRWHVCHRDRIAFFFGAITPAIEDEENYRGAWRR